MLSKFFYDKVMHACMNKLNLELHYNVYSNIL